MHSIHQSRHAPRVPRIQQFSSLGYNITIDESHQDKIEEKESFRKAQKTKKDHNNRLKETLIRILDVYPEYSITGIIELSDDQQKDKDKYYNNKYDLIYYGLDVSIIKAFMSAKKIKRNKTTEDGRLIHYSYSHIRKYKDAILYGSARCRQSLPGEYEFEKIFFQIL